ncbi:MAG: glycosyltransferase [Akkermansiaceae bacterium]|nr:glycosyltransferase [Akkermansiaceae bacterium]
MSLSTHPRRHAAGQVGAARPPYPLKMKFSIITPSFNQGRFLPDCVESVLSQTGVEIEHIVTDAGSTDETLEVLERYPHLQWISEPDKGMSDGINKGFRKATGDWVMWLNCDDYLLPGALAKVAKFIETHPNTDVVHGDCIYINDDKIPIRRKYDTAVDEWDFLFVGCCIPSTSTFYRKSIIEAGHLLDIDYRNCMDWEYYLRLTRLGYRFGYLPEALAHFRWYEESTTQKHWQRMIDEGLLAQREHLKARRFPAFLENASVLKFMRKAFQVRRVVKRFMTHGRAW